MKRTLCLMLTVSLPLFACKTGTSSETQNAESTEAMDPAGDGDTPTTWEYVRGGVVVGVSSLAAISSSSKGISSSSTSRFKAGLALFGLAALVMSPVAWYAADSRQEVRTKLVRMYAFAFDKGYDGSKVVVKQAGDFAQEELKKMFKDSVSYDEIAKTLKDKRNFYQSRSFESLLDQDGTRVTDAEILSVLTAFGAKETDKGLAKQIYEALRSDLIDTEEEPSDKMLTNKGITDERVKKLFRLIHKGFSGQ